MTCAAPHPILLDDLSGYHPDLEVVGTCSTDAWMRCRRCGRWFWSVADLGGKYEYVDARELDPDLATRALVDREPGAVFALLLRNGLPHGPVWADERAYLSLVDALLPGVGDAAVSAALRAAGATGTWQRVLDRLAARSRRDRSRSRPLAFAIDGPLDLEAEEAFELPGAVVLHTGDPPVLLWVRADGATMRYALPAAPRYLAHGPDRVLWALPSGDGEAVLVLGADGRLAAWPATPVRYLVSTLDDGWWLFVPEEDAPVRWAEFRRPDTSPAARIRIRLDPGRYPAAPRRMDGGWLAGGVVDDDGDPRPLVLFDASFGTVAVAEGQGGGRLVGPHGPGTAWAETLEAPWMLEHWARDGDVLRRTLALEFRLAVRAGDAQVVALRRGGLAGFDRDGGRLWERPEVPATAGYLASAGDRVIQYDDARIEVFRAADGGVEDRFDVFAGVQVLDDRSGTVYAVAGPALHVIDGGRVRHLALPWEARLETTCGDAAVVRETGGGRCLVVGRDARVRGAFDAPGARFSVVGTRAGPYVVEPARLRVGAFVPPPGADPL